MNAVISVNNLTKRYGEFVAVDHISFDVTPGQVIGYLGPNGSGKTTTIRMLLGLIRPSEGSARVLGFDAARQSEQIKARTGYMSQKFALYNELTARENLTFYAGVYGVRERSRVDAVLEKLELAAVAHQQVQTLSGGWRQRLALAAAIVHRPQLLLLDEPTSGVDPTARRAFWDLIYTLVAEGITILVTTHYMDEAEYCGQVGILNNGKLLALDSPTRLKESLPGKMWEISLTPADDAAGETTTASPLLRVLDQLTGTPGVLRVSLAGDHLRALTATGAPATLITQTLTQAGMENVTVEPSQAVMEDIFMALVGK
jgi:ABC-2 type transport system ATP-binding protein